MNENRRQMRCNAGDGLEFTIRKIYHRCGQEPNNSLCVNYYPLVKTGDPFNWIKGARVMAKHRKPSHQLTFEDAVKVHIMILDGWLQSRIAAYFDVNGGRISEVNTGKRHPKSKEVAVRRH